MNTRNIVASQYVEAIGSTFTAVDPSTNEPLAHQFTVAEPAFVNNALHAAHQAFAVYRSIGKDQKAAFLRAIAAELEANADAICTTAMAEAGLTEPRMRGEMGRTTGQLRLFAAVVEEGSWVDAIITTAQPDRTPLPRVDLRRMLVPVGPVVVFGASNFPLAFSVAGGDTAAALAAGCPVIAKVHPAHPGTSALVGAAISAAVAKTKMPAGVFSMLYDNGHAVGTDLVLHPLTKAVAFTGSLKGGMALHHLAQTRPDPIPVFAEMGSLNPVFLLPDALSGNAEEWATKLTASITNGAGQFCTKPGLLFGIASEGLTRFTAALAEKVPATQPVTMLTPGIFDNYRHLSAEALMEDGLALVVTSADHAGANHNRADAMIATVSGEHFLSNPKLAEEIFGPYALLVVAKDGAELQALAQHLQGQLTATLIASDTDMQQFSALAQVLQDKTGRLIYNGVPTGVEVCSAITHGGPFPATNNAFTSVGTTSITRFVRPLTWQDWPDEWLPEELKRENPYKIQRMLDDVHGIK